MEDWPPSQENILRMWRQIVSQYGVEENHTSEKWKEVYEDFVRCMMSPAEPFVVVQCIEGLLIPKPITAAAPKAPVPLSIPPPAPESSKNGDVAFEPTNLCEEEGASGGASHTPPKSEGSSEPDNLGEKENEEKSASDGEGLSQSPDSVKNANAVVEVENENPSQVFSLCSTSSELSSLLELSEEQLCDIFNDMTKLTPDSEQILGLLESNKTNIMKSKKSRKKNKKNKKRHH